ncbi:MAG: CHRD domain-containing protein [Pseudonocardiaceae bacterium]
MARVGACVAVVSSIVVFAGPASAAANSEAAMRSGYDRASFALSLSGDELRDGGDRDGRGFARLDLDAENERVCYVVSWSRLDGDVTAFHIHNAPSREDGPIWINFFNNRHFDGDRDTAASCVRSERWKIQNVIEHPSDYYLNLHTTVHEMGALRGQLG